MEQILKPNPLDGEFKMLLKIQFSVPRSQVGEFFKRGGGVLMQLARRFPNVCQIVLQFQRVGENTAFLQFQGIWT